MKADYIFASTYLRTLEKKLLNETDVARMVGAENANEALKVLENTNYAQEFKDSISKIPPAEYRKILSIDLSKGKEMLFSLTDDRELIKLILIYFDVYNIKVFFKEKLFKLGLEDIVSSHGTQKPQELRKAINEKQANIDSEFQEMIDEVRKKIKDISNPRDLDVFVEKQGWALHFKLSDRIGSEFVNKYSKERVDVINLKIAIRSYFLNRISDSKKWFIEGGSVDAEKLFKKTGKATDVQDLLKSLQPFYARIVAEKINFLLKQFKETTVETTTIRHLNKLFKDLADAEIEKLRESKFILAGPEVIFSYFRAKFNANINVRIIMEGKLNNFTKKEISERVRMSF